MSEFKRWLIERFKIERKRFDRTGVYAYTREPWHPYQQCEQ